MPPQGEALQGLRDEPEAGAVSCHQVRLPAAVCRRAGDWAPQGRAPHGPQPSRSQDGRGDQRGAGGGGLQLQAPAQVAGALVRPHWDPARVRPRLLATASTGR